MTMKWYGDQFSENIKRAVVKGVTVSSLIVEAEAVLHCPTHDSTLKNSIGHKVKEDIEGIKGKVEATAEHAPSVEFGRQPGKRPPVEPLKKWAKDVLGDEKAAYAVAKKIGKEGTEAQPFLRPALDNNKKKFEGIIAVEMKSVTG